MAEYLDSLADPRSDEELAITDIANLHQTTYYILAAVGLGPVQVVLRYDYAEAGIDEWMNDSDGILPDGTPLGDADEDQVMDNQTNYTLGVNYPLNDNTTVALNYAWRQPEEPDDFDNPDINEISVMVELDIL